jgi:hypothetical protein
MSTAEYKGVVHAKIALSTAALALALAILSRQGQSHELLQGTVAKNPSVT